MHQQIQAIVQSVEATDAQSIRAVFHVEWKFAASIILNRDELGTLSEGNLRDLLAEQVEEMINGSNSAEAIEIGPILNLENEETDEPIDIPEIQGCVVNASQGCATDTTCSDSNVGTCTGGCRKQPAILVSLNGGVTFEPALEGVRILYPNVAIDGEEEKGEVHINATTEGVVTDVWITDFDSHDYNIGTKSEMIDDIVSQLVKPID